MDKNIKKRVLSGIVVSEKMDKTIVVLVSTIKKHLKYQKQYKSSKKYHAHDPKNEYHEGDKVSIIESRPISKLKKWKVISKDNKIN